MDREQVSQLQSATQFHIREQSNGAPYEPMRLDPKIVYELTQLAHEALDFEEWGFNHQSLYNSFTKLLAKKQEPRK